MLKIMADVTVQELILKSIDEIKCDIKAIRKELAALKMDIIVLKTKAVIYGSLAGSIAVLAFNIVNHYLP